MIILEGKNIGKRYRRREFSVDALSDVSFTLNEGEILGIVGESGSGKSTLLRQIAGLEIPDAGELLLDGRPLPAKRTKENYRTIQMIFQDAVGSFHPRRRISDSIRETVRNLVGAGEEPDWKTLCSLVQLPLELAERYPRDLSGGQCQRFAIARAMAVHPRILLCDEITSALDVSSQAQILRLLAQLHQEKNMSVIFVSHDLAVVRSICDRVMVMRNGKVVEEGPAARIIHAPREDYTKQLIASVLEVRDTRAG
ncbi:MAG: ABC transporter ATP-binding protein [Oscillospiraceae bacterium]|nr:ABC transporter ATP-binding protein [Oscillospiraceae bacterium]